MHRVRLRSAEGSLGNEGDRLGPAAPEAEALLTHGSLGDARGTREASPALKGTEGRVTVLRTSENTFHSLCPQSIRSAWNAGDNKYVCLMLPSPRELRHGRGPSQSHAAMLLHADVALGTVRCIPTSTTRVTSTATPKSPSPPH